MGAQLQTFLYTKAPKRFEKLHGKIAFWCEQNSSLCSKNAKTQLKLTYKHWRY